MKLIKNICIATAVCGFILALGTAGTSDFEMEAGQILMTNTEFYMRMLVSLIMLVGGFIGVRVCNLIASRKRRYKALQREYRTYYN